MYLIVEQQYTPTKKHICAEH